MSNCRKYAPMAILYDFFSHTCAFNPKSIPQAIVRTIATTTISLPIVRIASCHVKMAGLATSGETNAVRAVLTLICIEPRPGNRKAFF